MRLTRPTMLVLAGGTALLAAVAEVTGAPQLVRAIVGIPLVLLLPGYVALCAVVPQRELSPPERALAVLGASLAGSTCVCVLLAALPVGLSARSASVTLGAGTAVLAGYAWRRTLSRRGSHAA